MSDSNLPAKDQFAHLFEVTEAKEFYSPMVMAKVLSLRGLDKPRYIDLLEYLKTLKPTGGVGAYTKELDKLEKEQRKAARTSGEDEGGEPGEDGFIRGKSGEIFSNAHNIRNAIEQLGMALRYDEFSRRVMLVDEFGSMEYLGDTAMKDLLIKLDDSFGFKPTRDYFPLAIGEAARRDRFHPVIERIDATDWDFVERIDTWLIDYFHIEDTEFHRTIGRIFLIAACRRLIAPGCKFDETLLIGGPQGSGKSTAIKILAMNPDWFTDSVSLTDNDQKIMENTQGKWIVEIPEMKGSRKADQLDIKAQLSRQVDRARPSYGWTVEEVARQFVIFMTTNNPKALTDPTGNRRFYPIWVDELVDLKGIVEVREQLWAEAMVYARAIKEDDELQLPKHLWDEARKVQAEHTRENAFEDTLRYYIPDDLNGCISSEELWGILKVPAGQRTFNSEMFGAALSAMGFIRKKRKYKGMNRVPCYVRGPDPAPELHVQHDIDGSVKQVTHYVALEDHRDEGLEDGDI